MVDPTAIQSLAIFRPLSPAAASALATRAIERRYQQGEVLYTTGSKPDGLLVVTAGRVRIVRGRRGRQHLVHEALPGGALGEVPIFDGGTYPATAIAAAPTRCLLIPHAVLHAIIRDYSEVGFLFLRRLAERTRLLVDRLDSVVAQDVSGRLAQLILQRHREAGVDAFTLGPTQHEVAEALGTVREVLVRSLRQLRSRGVIESAGRGRLRVRNLQALTDLAD
jgi:CRP/FNR family transcriptional regulator